MSLCLGGQTSNQTLMKKLIPVLLLLPLVLNGCARNQWLRVGDEGSDVSNRIQKLELRVEKLELKAGESSLRQP
jgi:hypothetical protein